MRDLRHGAYFGTKSIFETNMRQRNDKRIAVDHPFVIRCGNAIAFRAHKLYVGAPSALRKPNMAHGWEFEFSQYDFLSFAEVQRAGDAVKTRRNARDDGDFVGTGIDKLRKSSSRFLISFDP